MKVLHLLTALGHGGAEIWLLDMLRTVDRGECAMDFCLKASHLGKLNHVANELGARTFSVPLRPSHVGYLFGLARLLRQERYDILHTHEFIYSGLGVAVARACGVPAVCTFHHWTAPAELPITRLPVVRQVRAMYGSVSLSVALAGASAVTALSSKVLQSVVPNHAADPRCQLLSLSTSVVEAPDRAERQAMREKLGWPADAPVVIHVGRFIEQKNHDGVLDVFVRARREVPALRLILCGIGPLLQNVLARISSQGLSECVRYLGLRDDARRLMSLSDVLLFPSRTEGFGLVALEANACGIPVVGTRIEGLTEAVVDGETALLFQLGDTAGMADALVRITRDPEAAKELGEAGRRRARREYSHEASARKLLGVYRSVLRPCR